MKNLVILFLSIVLFYSCQNQSSNEIEEKNNKVLDEYCQCLKTIETDSTLNIEQVKANQIKCKESLISKHKIEKDASLINQLNDDATANNIITNSEIKVTQNINNYIQKYTWDGSVIEGNTTFVLTYAFEGKIVTITSMDIFDISNFDQASGTYKIENEQDGKTYITITFNNGDQQTLRFDKNEKSYCLDGGEFILKPELKK